MNFMIRAATADDVDVVVELINAAAIADAGMMVTNRDDKLIFRPAGLFSGSDEWVN
jgi:hypothetical protein